MVFLLDCIHQVVCISAIEVSHSPRDTRPSVQLIASTLSNSPGKARYNHSIAMPSWDPVNDPPPGHAYCTAAEVRRQHFQHCSNVSQFMPKNGLGSFADREVCIKNILLAYNTSTGTPLNDTQKASIIPIMDEAVTQGNSRGRLTWIFTAVTAGPWMYIRRGARVPRFERWARQGSRVFSCFLFWWVAFNPSNNTVGMKYAWEIERRLNGPTARLRTDHVNGERRRMMKKAVELGISQAYWSWFGCSLSGEKDKWALLAREASSPSEGLEAERSISSSSLSEGSE